MDFRERYQYDPKNDLVAKGGFSKVYRAYDRVLNRKVGLKVYSTEASGKYDLINEISKVIEFEHPNLCRYYDVAVLEFTNAFGEEEKSQIGVMEFLDGGDIRSYLKRNPGQLDSLLKDTLKGLAYLHEQGIIHRDLKPQNILIKTTPKGPVAKITDFGISKIITDSHVSKSSSLLGTVQYMAPEQFNLTKYGINGKLSTNLDLWSFGVMTYELVSNKSILGEKSEDLSTEEVIIKILDGIDEERIQSLPEPYRTMVTKCLVKDARQRVQKAGELLKLLDKETGSGDDTSFIPGHEEPPRPVPEPPKPPKKKSGVLKPLLFIGSLVLLSILGYTGYKLLVAGTMRMVLQPASKEGKWGFRDSLSGKEIVPFNYDYVDSFFNRIAIVDSNKLFGLIDSTGKRITDCKYEFIWRSKNGALIRFLQNKKIGFLNRAGMEVIPAKYDDAKGTGYPITIVEADGKYGVVDSSGKEIINPTYDYIGDFAGGMAYTKKYYEYGFIDSTGKEVVSPKYSSINNFSEGVAVVVLNNKYGIIDRSGREVVSPKYNLINDSFQEGFAWFGDGSKYGFLNREGQEVISAKYDNVGIFSAGMAAAEINGKWGYIDKEGRQVIAPKYDHTYYFKEGFAPVYLNSKFGFVDSTGKEIVSPLYTDVTYVYEGLAGVATNGKWGFIDKTGKEVIALKYDSVTMFQGGYAGIELHGKWGFINKQGKEVVVPAYNSLDYFPSIGHYAQFKEGLAQVQLNSKWGFVDTTGKEVIAPIYDYIDDFNQGLSLVKLDGEYRYINKAGQYVAKYVYNSGYSSSADSSAHK